MKRLFQHALGAVLLALVLVRCGSDSVTAPGVVSVTLSPPSATLRVGATVQLSATILVDGVASAQTITFATDNAAVVSVTAAGLVRALTPGTANLSGTLPDGHSASAAVTVIPGLPVSITKLAGDNQTAVAGAALANAPSVTVKDSAGNVTPGVPVSFVVTSGGGSIANATATTNAGGMATAGAWTLGNNPGANSLSASVSGAPTVTFSATGTTPPAAALVVNAGNGQTAPAGTAVAVAPSVKVTTASGLPSPGVDVTFAVSAGGGSVTAATATTNVAGIATVGAWTLGAVGLNTLVASANGVGTVTFSATATSPFVLALSPAAVSISTEAGTSATRTVSITNGGASAVSGIALDAPVYSANGSQWLTATLNSTTAPATVTLVANTAGLPVGTYTATVAVQSTVASNSPQTITVTLTVTTPSQTLVVATQPSGTTTGLLLAPQPVVEVRDQGNALVSSFNGQITVALTGSRGTLSGTTTLTAVAGVATFTDLRVNGAGTFALQFSSPLLGSTSSSSFVLTGLPATQLAITMQPAGGAAGTALSTSPVVQMRDANGALVVGSDAIVTAALAAGGGSGTLSGTTSVMTVDGIATFNDLKISATGTYALVFTTGALPPVTSLPVTITAAAPSALVLTTQPTGAPSGVNLGVQPVVELRDATNARVVGATNAVTATLVGNGGTLSGTTIVAAVNGIATFTDLKVSGPGSYTLVFTSGALSPATSGSFTISAALPTQLSLAVAPVGAVAGAALTTQPVINIRDASNGLVTSSTAAVTVSIASGPGTLAGTTTVNAVNGVATFTNLKIGGGTPPYAVTLQFTSPGLTPVTSAAVTVAAPSIAVNVGAAATATGTIGTNLAVPVSVNMGNAAGQTLASLTFDVTWDPAKLTFVSKTDGSFGSSPSYTVNTASAATGVLRVSVFDTDGFSTGSPTIFTVTLVPAASAAGTVVSTLITAAGSDTGASIPGSTFVVRNLAVTIP
jgi:hypothetical protein